jgi:tape measure domain-containing protein
MASGKNLALQILISARDAASGVFRRLGSVLGDIRTQVVSLVASFGLLRAATGSVNAAADFEALKTQFAAMEGGADAGAKKLAELEAAFGLRQVDQATQLYAQLASLGLKPTVDQLGDLIDYNARTGKGAENLAGIVVQLGQAWSKEKLQQEDAQVLAERGVPVWQLLSSATGVAAKDIMKMATEGELGRKAITLLIAEMGKLGEGASSARLSTWNGLVESATALWQRFQLTLAEGWIFEQSKGYLSQLADAIEGAIKDGTAARWGKEIGDGAKAVAERLGELLTTAKQHWADWGAGAADWAAGTRRVLSGLESAWLAFRAVVEGVAAGITAVIGATQARFAMLHEGLARLGVVSEEAAARSRKAAETMIQAAADYAAASRQHFAEAGSAALAAVGRQEQAAAGAAQASAAASAATEDWRLDMGQLNAELQRAGVLITADTAAARAQGEAAQQAGAATGDAAAGIKLGADALREHAAASKEAGKAAEDLADAQADLAKAQQTKAREKDPYGWEDAAMAASRAASQINSGQADRAIQTITNAYRGLAEAVQRGDTSAGIEVVARQLDELAKRAEKAAAGVDQVKDAGKKRGDKSGEDEPSPERAAVEAAFAKPIPLTFDVAAGAAAAATQVADAIVAAVTERLAGARFSVPVTAIVTVDAGGADEISLEAAKRGSRTE